jgi:dTDP-glucose 4,6-dehydratase
MRDLPGDDPKQREPDISKASEVLNWKPQINRETGLLSTIEYFKRELNLA